MNLKRVVPQVSIHQSKAAGFARAKSFIFIVACVCQAVVTRASKSYPQKGHPVKQTILH